MISEAKLEMWCTNNFRKMTHEMNSDNNGFDSAKYAGFLGPLMHPELEKQHSKLWADNTNDLVQRFIQEGLGEGVDWV
jgi:hypothetical protein